STVSSAAQCGPCVISLFRQGFLSRRNGSSLSGSAPRLPRHATYREGGVHSQAARKSARDGYSPSSVSIRLSWPHSTTSWRSRIPWSSRAWRRPCKCRRVITVNATSPLGRRSFAWSGDAVSDAEQSAPRAYSTHDQPQKNADPTSRQVSDKII